MAMSSGPAPPTCCREWPSQGSQVASTSRPHPPARCISTTPTDRHSKPSTSPTSRTTVARLASASPSSPSRPPTPASGPTRSISKEKRRQQLAAEEVFSPLLVAQQRLAAVGVPVFAVDQHVATITAAERFFGVLFDHQNRRACLVDRVDTVEHIGDEVGRESGRRLVEQQ